jgi:endonuclease-3
MTLKERYNGVTNYFLKHVPTAETELNYSNPFELLVAVILSAQCTDKRINQVTPKLFKDFPTPEVMAASNSDTIFNYIRSVSYPNNKAKHLVNMANMLLKDFKGIIPSEIDELVKLPGVGRKTANVVASVIYEKPAMAVDTHVFRVSNRLGLTKAKTPLQSEQQLIKHIPQQYIATAHHWLILHGRYTCLARTPKCESCPLTEWCVHFKKEKLNNKDAKVLDSKNKPMAKTSTKKPLSTSVTKTKKADTLKAKTETKSLSVKKVAVKKVAEPKASAKKVESKFVAHSTSIKVGDKAPVFKAKNQNGELISSTDFKGKKIVLYFYPKDNTPGCTMEACSLRDEYNYLTKNNYAVIGVSADDETMHSKFAKKYELPFSLLADTDKTIIKAYDVWGKKQFMGKIFDGIIRTTFIIDEKGKIASVITDVKTKEHGKQIKEIKLS